MKESKFIELLNLYVDQQIEPEEAKRLEEEILRNPGRRCTYQQYCRMQRACALLVEQIRPEVSVGEKFAATVAHADEKVMEFPDQRAGFTRFVYFGGLVAACFAVMFMVGRTVKSTTRTPVASGGDQVVQIAPAALVKGQSNEQRINYQPVLVTHSLRLSNAATPSAASAITGEQLSLDWMNQVKFTPVSVSSQDLVLGNQPSIKSKDREKSQSNVFGNAPVQDDADDERFALRFQR